MQKKEIELDTFTCKGCGACAEVAPEHFKMNEVLEVPEVVDTVVEGEHEDLEQAQAMCPRDCIAVHDTSND